MCSLAAAFGLVLLGGLVVADAPLSLRSMTLLAALLGLVHGTLNGSGMGLSAAAAVALFGLAATVFLWSSWLPPSASPCACLGRGLPCVSAAAGLRPAACCCSDGRLAGLERGQANLDQGPVGESWFACYRAAMKLGSRT